MDESVAIIGGGPGGLAAAIRAAELGLKVVLYEKGKIGDTIKCGEGFIDTLGVVGRPEAGVLFRVERAIFFAGKEYHVRLIGDCGIWMIDRSTWQRELARRAQEMGVLIKEDFPIGPRQLKETLEIHGYVIDASGAPSVTSRACGFVPLYLRHASLFAQYVIEGDFRFLGKHTIKAGYEPHYLGYYWIFPKGEHMANVGVGRFHRDKKGRGIRLRQELGRILRKEGLDGYRVVKKVSSFSPSNGVDKLVWGRTLLVGDAAALCSPLHGGGMDMACISGRLAAETIALQKVSRYPIKLWDLVGKKLTMEKRIFKLWHFFGYPFLIGVLKCKGLPTGIIFNRRPIPQILGLGGKKMF